MARLSINELTTYRWSFEDDVANYKAAGVEAIGLWRPKLADFGEEKGIELLADSGLAVSNVLWAGGFTGSDGRGYRDAIDDALEAVRLAGRLGAGTLVVYTGARAGHTHNHARRLVLGALKEMIPPAGELGVCLAIEPMHPGCAGDCTFLTSLDDALALIDAAENSHVKLVLDTYHFGLDPALLERLSELASRIAVVHLGDCRQPPEKDQNRCPLGEGAVPLAAIISALSQHGYDGYYDVELIGEDVEASDYHQLVEHSRAAFDRLAG